MNTRILTTRDAEAWNGYLARLPGADIYHTPEYHAAHEANGDGTALCFVAEEGENLLLHPFMLRDIPGTGWRDIETVYGYGGPLANQGAGSFLRMASACWVEYCRRIRVVAEFIRFNPISGNHALYHPLATKDRETVVLDLSGTPADLMARYSKRHRNMIRRAEREGLVCWQLCTGREIPPAFIDLYSRTMARCAATEYYSFGPAYFDALRHGLGDRLLLFGVQGGTTLSAAAIFMRYGDRLHYHLAGSDPNSPGYGDNNLLLHTAALWGQANGCRWLHLGGGRTPNPGDSLLHFKSSVSSERRVFYTGRRVHNQAAYDQLCGEWMARHQDTVAYRPDYFLLWRKP